MHLSRRVVAPLVGVALALSMVAAPASAATRTQELPGGTDVCNALFQASQNLPDNPFIQQIWSTILSFFDCDNNTV